MSRPFQMPRPGGWLYQTKGSVPSCQCPRCCSLCNSDLIRPISISSSSISLNCYSDHSAEKQINDTWNASLFTTRLRQDSLHSTSDSDQSTASSRSKNNTRYSKKVFIGRLPDFATSGTNAGCHIETFFRQFGRCEIEWPKPPSNVVSTKLKSKLQGYMFVLYHKEISVHDLLDSCKLSDSGQYYVEFLENLGQAIHIRPFDLKNQTFYRNPMTFVNYRLNTVFLGRVPRMVTAQQVFQLMEVTFGPVKYVEIDLDHKWNYPQGTAAVFFKSEKEYMHAVRAKRIDMQMFTGREWTTEIKPFVLFGTNCEQCHMFPSQFFCNNLKCLQYYCRRCWPIIHRGDCRDHDYVAVQNAIDTPISSHIRCYRLNDPAPIPPKPLHFTLVSDRIFLA